MPTDSIWTFQIGSLVSDSCTAANDVRCCTVIRSPRRRGICFPSPIRAGDLIGIAPTLRLRTKVLQVIRERIVARSALHRHAQTRPTPWEGEMKAGTVIAAGMIGNVLEWYDFAIYGYFAAAIGRQFFPHEDAVAQLLSAFGVFALGYLMRPVGGALIGHIGDQFGRRAALTLSVAAMAIPTFLIGLLPGYATLGLWAPAALTLLRMTQGFWIGGEFTSSVVFLIERAPEGRRGLMGALAMSGATGGILLGSAVGAAFAAALPTTALETWGWRIPFLLGLIVGIAGYFLRRHVLEMIPTVRRKRSPIIDTLHHHWRTVIGFAGLSFFGAAGFYVCFVYLVSWLQTADRFPASRALEINSFSMAMMLPTVILAGLLSDRFGR